jgi:hypothetical protein
LREGGSDRDFSVLHVRLCVVERDGLARAIATFGILLGFQIADLDFARVFDFFSVCGCWFMWVFVLIVSVSVCLFQKCTVRNPGRGNAEMLNF